MSEVPPVDSADYLLMSSVSPTSNSRISTPEVQEQVSSALILMGATSLAGTVGNLLVILVYRRKRDSQTANTFISLLAMVDCFTCAVIIPLTMWFELRLWRISNEVFCRFYHFLNTSSIPFSSLLISAIAVDRYLCICHPFKHLMTVPRAKRLVLLLACVAIALGILASLHSGLHPLQETLMDVELENRTNQSLTSPMECLDATLYVDVGDHRASFLDKAVVYLVQVSNLVCFLVCILSVAILYILIYRSVAQQRQKRKYLRGSSRSKHAASHSTNTAGTDPPAVSTTVISGGDNNITIVNASVALVPLLTSEEQSKPHEEETELKEIVADTSNTPAKKPHSSFYFSRKIAPREGSWRHNSGNNQNSGFRRISSRFNRSSATVQNVKTAAMLFVVAVVFVGTYTPALLMATGLVRLNLLGFYLYYLNNSANPIIYGFMNSQFRRDVVQLFCKGTTTSGGHTRSSRRD